MGRPFNHALMPQGLSTVPLASSTQQSKPNSGIGIRTQPKTTQPSLNAKLMQRRGHHHHPGSPGSGRGEITCNYILSAADPGHSPPPKPKQKTRKPPAFQHTADLTQLRAEQANQSNARHDERGKSHSVQMIVGKDRLPDLADLEQVVPVEEAADALAIDVCQ